MSIIETITPEDFKNQFPRFTPVYLPVYSYQTYVNGDIVYYNGAFYQCKVASSNNVPTNTTDWKPIQANVLNYTQDSDIINAMAEAKVNFNEGLFTDCCTAKLVFLYLTAHYLTVDFRNAMGGNIAGIPTSKSVGSVSEGYSILPWIQNNPNLSMYATTGYGLKYCSLIKPYLCGNIILSKGGTTTG